MEEKIPLTVTALTKYIKFKFDCDYHLKDVLLEGEISNFKRHSRGHFYFTLKDKNAAISATMFYSYSKDINFEPQDGMNVIVKGNVTVYEPAGSYSINIYEMEQKGIGSLYLAYEKLKKELGDLGYFDASHKKDIPLYPKAIAVLTSPTGAAVRDCINTIGRRYPLAKVYVYPTLVQGEDAKYSIVNNIKKANSDGLADTIIVGRGGGSIEDLWAFNERIVVEAIYNSKLPIISAVGHETDFTLADFVADRRAATPTAAAELATPDIRSLKENVLKNKERIMLSFKKYLENIETKLLHLDKRFEALSPANKLSKMHDKALEYNKLLSLRFKNILDLKRHKMNVLNEKLILLNPLAIMDKGYSVLMKDGTIIKSKDDVSLGDEIIAKMKDGNLKLEVKEKL